MADSCLIERAMSGTRRRHLMQFQIDACAGVEADSAKAHWLSGTVTPIRVATGKTLAAIKVGTNPGFIAITPNGKTVYVTNA